MVTPGMAVPGTRPTDTDAPDWLKRTLEEFGLVWPKGDVVKLYFAGDAWNGFATKLREVKGGSGAGADGQAALVWADNVGKPIDDFRQWWSWRRGPSANLAGAAIAADAIGASLKGMSLQVALLKLAFVANLAAIGAAAAALGIAIVGSGGLAAAVAAAGGGVVVNYVRRRVQRAMQAALASVTAHLVGVLLRQAAENLTPAPVETVPRRDRRTRPDPGPLPVPIPLPGPDSHPRRRRRCEAEPPATTPVITGIPPTSGDARFAGVGLQSISRRVLEDGSREVVIEGVVRDTIPRAHLERELRPLAESIGIPSGRYHLAHTWGPGGTGNEAAAGIYLAPTTANLSFHSSVEDWLQDLHATRGPGGWVELTTVTTTHPAAAWNGTGANLMASTTYEVTVCRAGGVIETYPPVSVDIGLPSMQGGVFQPGRVTPRVN